MCPIIATKVDTYDSPDDTQISSKTSLVSQGRLWSRVESCNVLMHRSTRSPTKSARGEEEMPVFGGVAKCSGL